MWLHWNAWKINEFAWKYMEDSWVCMEMHGEFMGLLENAWIIHGFV